MNDYLKLAIEILAFFGGIIILFPRFGTWITFGWCAFWEIMMVWDYEIVRYLRKFALILLKHINRRKRK